MQILTDIVFCFLLLFSWLLHGAYFVYIQGNSSEELPAASAWLQGNAWFMTFALPVLAVGLYLHYSQFWAWILVLVSLWPVFFAVFLALMLRRIDWP